jgi:CBS domain containing-hemolysin-like protein
MLGQATLILCGLAVLALLAGLAQWRVRGRPRARALPDSAFWVGVTAWVALGLTAGRSRIAVTQGALVATLLAIVGLVGAALLQWLRVERRGEMRRAGTERGAPGSADAPEAAVLDAEDRRLARRLLSLRGRPAAQPMLSLARAATLGEDASVGEALDLLRRTRVTRIPVLDRTGRRAIGVIDGRDLIAIDLAPDEAAGRPELSRASSVRAILAPLPEVRADSPLLAVLDTLREKPGGVVAVVDATGVLLGFLSWRHLFHALVGRPVGEVTL